MTTHTDWLSKRGNAAVYQMVQGQPYFTRYFCNEPIMNPEPYMAGQRVYRDFVLEDKYRLNRGVQIELIKDDHSFFYIEPFSDGVEKYHYFKEST